MSDFKVEIKTSEVFPEVKIIKPDPWYDYRGEMWSTWDKDWEILPKEMEWTISKFTRSRKNVLRGLHGDSVTWKYVHSVYGEIYQVVVDNRPDSVNYLKWEGYILSDRNHIGILIPAGFVNGHLCLTDECEGENKEIYTTLQRLKDKIIKAKSDWDIKVENVKDILGINDPKFS